MDEWEAKYKALLMGIDNEEYIKNAEKFVKTALDISLATPLRFWEVFDSMREIIGAEQMADTMRTLEERRHGWG